MKQTIEDKLVSKVSKGKLNTIHVSREEMADLVDQHFIQNAETEEEYKQIWKVIKRGILFDKMIYTKDGKGIVRVPQKRTELKIKEGCTEFNMQSVLYNSTDSEGDEFNNCSKLKKIVIPSSVKSINKIKYKTDRADACDMHVDTIEIAP